MQKKMGVRFIVALLAIALLLPSMAVTVASAQVVDGVQIGRYTNAEYNGYVDFSANHTFSLSAPFSGRTLELWGTWSSFVMDSGERLLNLVVANYSNYPGVSANYTFVVDPSDNNVLYKEDGGLGDIPVYSIFTFVGNSGPQPPPPGQNTLINLYLVIDTSGSMGNLGGAAMTAAKNAANHIASAVMNWRSDNRVAVIGFDTSAYLRQGLTGNLADVTKAINGLYASGSTNMHAGLSVADQEIQKANASNARNIIFFLGDGLPEAGPTAPEQVYKAADWGKSSSFDYGRAMSWYGSAVVLKARPMWAYSDIYSISCFESMNDALGRNSGYRLLMDIQNSGYYNAPGASDIDAIVQQIIDDIEEPIPPTGLVLTPSTLNMKVGDIQKITAIWTPSNTTQKTIVYTSSNEQVAKVNPLGEVTAVGEGSCVITGVAQGAVPLGSVSGATTVIVGSEGPQVESIIVSPPSMTLEPAQTGYFTATVLPATANAPISWSSSNPAVGTIDQSGKVTAIANGKTTITASVGGKSGSATLTVEKGAKRITVSPALMELEVGKTGVFTATVHPADASARFSWTSSNPDVATVDGSGRVTALKKGETTISAWSDGMAGHAQLRVKEGGLAPEKVTVTPSVAGIKINETIQLRATVSPASAPQNVTWKSLQPDIASVTSSGSVKGLKKGTAVIQATTANGISGTAVVSVDNGGGSGTAGDGKTNYYALALGYDEFWDDPDDYVRGMDANLRYAESHLETYTQYSNVTVKRNRTLNQTKNDIKIAFKKADADDVSLLYLAGWGNRNKAGNCTIRTSDGQFWSLKSLRAWLDVIPGKVVVLLDLNYAGAFISKGADGGNNSVEDFNSDVLAAFSEAPNGLSSRALNNKKYLVLTAASEYETAKVLIYDGDYMAIFSYYLLKGLQPDQADASGDDIITFAEMYNRLPAQLKAW